MEHSLKNLLLHLQVHEILNVSPAGMQAIISMDLEIFFLIIMHITFRQCIS